ncbi:unnamed protein product [Dicrocoelium dendriticum]|nr:unnamed protein product [Dicrocoelium dendriticum]
MDGVSCQCLRLRKKENMTTCPILLQFPDDRSASKFVRSKRLVAAQTNFKNIIIKHDQTPLQRRLTMKQNPSTHHMPHVPTNEASTDAIISNVDLDKSTASSNIGDDGHLSLQQPDERISNSSSDVSKTKTTNNAENTTTQTPADHTLNSPIPSPNCEPLQQFTVTVPETYHERDKKADCNVGSPKNKSLSDPNELSYRLSPTNRGVGKNRGKRPARISPINAQSSLSLKQPSPERRDVQLGQLRKSIRPQAYTYKTDTVVGISCREPAQYLPTMPLTTFPNPATSSWQSPYVCDTELANKKLVGHKDLQLRGCNPYLPQVKIHPPPPAVLLNWQQYKPKQNEFVDFSIPPPLYTTDVSPFLDYRTPPVPPPPILPLSRTIMNQRLIKLLEYVLHSIQYDLELSVPQLPHNTQFSDTMTMKQTLPTTFSPC